jgi:hypothetical protein
LSPTTPIVLSNRNIVKKNTLRLSTETRRPTFIRFQSSRLRG